MGNFNKAIKPATATTTEVTKTIAPALLMENLPELNGDSVTIIRPDGTVKTIEASTEVAIDRDWASFDPAGLDTLSIEDLTLYSEWQEKEEARMEMLNKIRSRQVATIAAKESALKAQLDIAETSRRVVQTQAQVEYAQTKGSELDDLARSVGTSTMADQFDREKTALTDLGKLGKETPVLGQIALLQAQVLHNERMNMAANIQNSIAPLVQSIAPAAEKSAQTIEVSAQ